MMFIRGHAPVHLLPPADTSSYALHIYLELVSTAFLGVGRRGVFYYCKFTPYLWHDFHLPIFEIFLIYKVRSPKPWNFGKILRSTLRSWGFILID